MKIILNEKIKNFIDNNDCIKLKNYLTLINLENFENYFNFEDLEEIDNLTNEEKLILGLVYFVNNYILKHNKCLEVLNTIISIITKFSKEDITQCLIDENEKIFTSLKKILKLYNKLHFSFNFNELFFEENFIKFLIDKAHTNYQNQINSFSDDEELKKLVQESFQKNISIIYSLLGKLIQVDNSIISNDNFKNESNMSIDMDSFLSKIEVNLKQHIEKILEKTLKNIETSSNMDISNDAIDILNSNLLEIKKILETLEQNIHNALEEQFNSMKEFLNNNTNTLNDILNASLEEFKSQISSLALLDDKINYLYEKSTLMENNLKEILETVKQNNKIILEEHKEYEKVKEKYNFNNDN